MSWWMANNHRVIQNNLREIDVRMDITAHIKWLQSLQCNAFMVNCGGISAFYPTEVKYHYQNPFLRDGQDFIRDVVDACRRENIRVIARFDFSKTDISLYENNQEWYTRDFAGNTIEYAGAVATCVNGYYQQYVSLEILREAISKYKFDGVFFNMFGFYDVDVYTKKKIGICQCRNCKDKYKEMYGSDLPTAIREDSEDYWRYSEFKKKAVESLLEKIHVLVKEIDPSIAISTYSPHKIDMIRDESNSAVDRPLPFWLYQSSDNTLANRTSYPSKVTSNCVINAVDIFPRFMGVSKHLTSLRLLENMASGSGLDYCIIGSFEDYPDKKSLEQVRTIFNLHAKFESIYSNLVSQSRVLLIKPSSRTLELQDADLCEYRGIFKILKESHIPFDVIYSDCINEDQLSEKEYDVIIVPGIAEFLSNTSYQYLKDTRAVVLATASSFSKSHENRKQIFGVVDAEYSENVRGSYLEVLPESVFKSFQNTKWVFLDAPFMKLTCTPKNNYHLPVISDGWFAPPERCYGLKPSKWHGLTSLSVDSANGTSTRLYMPWNIGAMYYYLGYEEHKNVLVDLLRYYAPNHASLKVSAPPCVEVFIDLVDENLYFVQLINLSGFNGTSVSEPLPINNIEIDLINKRVISAKNICDDALCPIQGAKIIVDQIACYAAILVSVDT